MGIKLGWDGGGGGGGVGVESDTAALAAIAVHQASQRYHQTASMVRLREFSPAGNGTTDDAGSLKAFEAAIATAAASGPVFAYVDPGRYRFATVNPSGGAALVLNALSNVTLAFAPGAELLMDNLSSGNGTSHGIYVRGAGSNIRLASPRVRWLTPPTNRSTGDGIRFTGYPGDGAVQAGFADSTGALRSVWMTDAYVENAPQTGVIFMGVSDPHVRNFEGKNTKADNCHFNACRRVDVSGVTGTGSGDDVCAFVTYYHPTDVAAYGDGRAPFTQPSLSEWSNSGTATNINGRSSSANGLRLAGALDLAVSNLSVRNASVGVIVDGGVAGGAFNWTYEASRNCTVDGMAIALCDTGILGQIYNADSTSDPRYTRYGVKFSNGGIRDCANRGIRTQGSGGTASIITGLDFDNIHVVHTGTNAAASFASLRGASVKDITAEGGKAIEFYGQDSPHSGALSALPRHDVNVDGIVNRAGTILFQDVRDYSIGSLVSLNASGSGVTFTRAYGLQADTIRVILANRGNTSGYGLRLSKVHHAQVGLVDIEHDASTTGWTMLEIGGGDATDVAGTNLRLEKMVYRNTINQADAANVTIQGGSFAPVNYIYRLTFLNGGEAVPVWRTRHRGNLGWVDTLISTGTPEGVWTAPVGSQYQRTDGGAGTTLYKKETGTSNTGWVAS